MQRTLSTTSNEQWKVGCYESSVSKGQTCIDWPGVVEFWKRSNFVIPSDESRMLRARSNTCDASWADYTNNDRPGYCPWDANGCICQAESSKLSR